jgi:hypothetical protein
MLHCLLFCNGDDDGNDDDAWHLLNSLPHKRQSLSGVCMYVSITITVVM